MMFLSMSFLSITNTKKCFFTKKMTLSKYTKKKHCLERSDFLRYLYTLAGIVNGKIPYLKMVLGSYRNLDEGVKKNLLLERALS